ncbi:MAG: DUF58 domain-containing protein [Bacteroidota bacterium]
MRATRVLVGILILSGLAGVLISGAKIYSRLLYLGILLVLLSAVWTASVARSLRVERHTRSLRANVGDLLEEHFEIFNGSYLLALWVEVLNETPIPGAAGSRLLTLIGGRRKRTYTSRTWLTRRGAFALGPTSLTAGDPFGLFRIRRRFPGDASLVVIPMIVDLASFASPPGLLSGGRVIPHKATDVTPHAAGVREYVPGDPMKRIHWPTTVRRGEIMVKEFEQDPQAEIWLFLDAEETVHYEKSRGLPEQKADAMLYKVDSFLFGRRPEFHLPPSTLEYAVTISASLAHYFLAQGRAVGLVTSGRAYTAIPAERSERQESKILETLAFVEAESSLSLAGLVAAQGQQLPPGSSAILITPTISSELLAAVDDLQRRRLHPIVILLASQSFGGPPGTDRLMHSLAEHGVPVCPIYCDADLPSVLAAFASNSLSQDVRIWQRPPLPHLT